MKYNDGMINLLYEKAIIKESSLTIIEETALEGSIDKFIKDTEALTKDFKISKNKSIMKAKVLSLIGIGMNIIALALSASFPLASIVSAVIGLITVYTGFGFSMAASAKYEKLQSLAKTAKGHKLKATNKKDTEALDRLITKIEIAMADTKDRGKDSNLGESSMLEQVKFI